MGAKLGNTAVRGTSAYRVPAVEHTLELLVQLRDNSGPRGRSLSEVCDAAEVPRSSGLTILRTLASHGYVRFDPDTRRYRLGSALVGLGLRASEDMAHADVLHSHLVYLEQKTHLTAILGRVVGENVLVVDKVEGSRDIRATASIGQLFPIAAGALGKAVFAYKDDGLVRDYVRRVGLPAYTQLAVRDLNGLQEELALVRKEGYSRSLEEYVCGVNGVGAPIFDASGQATLSVALLGLVSCLPSEKVDAAGLTVLGVARRMTAAIGGIWRGLEPHR